MQFSADDFSFMELFFSIISDGYEFCISNTIKLEPSIGIHMSNILVFYHPHETNKINNFPTVV